MNIPQIEQIVETMRIQGTTKLSIENRPDKYAKHPPYDKFSIFIQNNGFEIINRVPIRTIIKLYKLFELRELSFIGFKKIPKWILNIISEFRYNLTNVHEKNLTQIIGAIKIIDILEVIINSEKIEESTVDKMASCVINGKIKYLILHVRYERQDVIRDIMAFQELVDLDIAVHRLTSYQTFKITAKIE